MPNHVVNILTGPDLSKYLTKKEDKLIFDFNQFIPKPEGLFDESVNSRVQSAAKIALGLVDFKPQKPSSPGNWDGIIEGLERSNCIRQLTEGTMVKDFRPDEFEEFIGMMRSYMSTGHLSWSTWAPKNWGTKWNSYDVEQVVPNVLRFETAWSAPFPVIAKIPIEQAAVMLHEWADEDMGENVGYAKYYPDGTVERRDLGGTKEGMELAMRLRGCTNDYHWNTTKGAYIHNEYGDDDE